MKTTRIIRVKPSLSIVWASIYAFLLQRWLEVTVTFEVPDQTSSGTSSHV